MAKATDTSTTTAPEPVEQKTEDEQKKKNRLRNEAEREVLNAHREEFQRLVEQKFAAEGLTYNRRLTEDEKAEKKMRELLEQHPELAERFSQDGPQKTA